MQESQADYTNTFLYIWGNTNISNTEIYSDERFISWLEIWKQRVGSVESAQASMVKYNPVYIPRNHIVEGVLDEAVSWNYDSFHAFLEVLKNPYIRQKDCEKYMEHDFEFEKNYQTFCGT